MEKFRKGHGFLRPLPGGEQLPADGPAAPDLQRGVYVCRGDVAMWRGAWGAVEPGGATGGGRWAMDLGHGWWIWAMDHRFRHLVSCW